MKGCGTVLVLDGNKKNNRPVCAAQGAGYVEYEGLPGKVKTGCMNTPEQQSMFCYLHKPRKMEVQSEDAQRQQQVQRRVIEMVLAKKQTRNGTYYQVYNLHCTYMCLYHCIYILLL